MSAPKFAKGAAAAEQRAAENSKSGNFARLRYLTIDEGKQAVIRFLTDGDEWITVKQHTSVPTKNPPADAKNWPKSLPAVCRYDEAFEGIFHDCYICDKPIINPRNDKPVTAPDRTYALAVIRNEVAPGKYADDTVEVTRTVDGQEVTTTELNIVVVNYAMKNFFGAISGYYGMMGSLKNTDLVIKRKGKGLDTDYIPLPIPNSEVLSDTEWAERYGKALVAQNLDLGEIVADKASDDFYRRFFDARYGSEATASVPEQAGAPAVEQDAAPSNDVPEDALEEMRRRVRGYSSATAE
jgi:hypothetical protein